MFNLLYILFPRFCLGCGKEGKYICENCQNFLGEASLICPVCSKPSFTGEKHSNCSNRYTLDGFTAIWEYQGIVQELIHTVKYRGISNILSEAVAKAFEVMLKDEIRFKPFFQFLLLPDVYISYVPMFRKKEKQRGFNQAQLIAQEISKTLEKPVLSLLEKIKDTQSQTDLTREQRIENVKESFSLRKQVFLNRFPLSTPYSSRLTGLAPRLKKSVFSANDKPLDTKNLFSRPKASVLLVDDIWTTGATMRECCKVLKMAGIERVWGFTLARTV